MKLYNDDGTQCVELKIPHNKQNVLVNVSGGADSAILLYMVAKYIKDNNRDDIRLCVITCSNDKKGQWNGRRAMDVVEYVRNKLDANIFMHYVYSRDIQDVTYFHEVEGFLRDKGALDFILSGITSNPHDKNVEVTDCNGNIINLYETGLPERNYDPSNPQQTISERFSNPYANVDKKMIAHLYKHFGVEDLFSLTRSCETIPDPEKLMTPSGIADQSKTAEHCGDCWWCLERKWAFGKL